MSLPPLPAPDWLERKGFLFDVDSTSLSNRSAAELVEMSKVQAYGQQCRAEALEEAAKACQSQADQLMYPSTGNAIALVCAGKIRSMK